MAAPTRRAFLRGAGILLAAPSMYAGALHGDVNYPDGRRENYNESTGRWADAFEVA